MAVFAVVALAAWMLYPVVRLQYEQHHQVASLQSELDGLKARNKTLRSQVGELKTPAGVEQAAREDLGYVKKGENAVVVTGKVATGTASASRAASSAAAAGDQPLLTRLLDAVFGLR